MSRLDASVEMAQRKLAVASNELLIMQLADTAIALAYRMNESPHSVLEVARKTVAFTEQQWWEEVKPELDSFLLVPAACEECHGEGTVPVPGYSVNPASGYLGPDPQAVGEAVCPACRGTGEREESA